jgi:hypothetical protein
MILVKIREWELIGPIFVDFSKQMLLVCNSWCSWEIPG